MVTGDANEHFPHFHVLYLEGEGDFCEEELPQHLFRDLFDQLEEAALVNILWPLEVGVVCEDVPVLEAHHNLIFFNNDYGDT